MGQGFAVSQFSISNFKHIGIIPSSNLSVFFKANLKLKILKEGSPMIRDVSSGSPRISNASSPFPNFLLTPVANGVKNRSSSFIKSLSHQIVSHFCSHIGSMTIVILQVVNSKIKVWVTPILHRFVHQFSQSHSFLVFPGRFGFLRRYTSRTWVLYCGRILRERPFQKGTSFCLRWWPWWYCLGRFASSRLSWRKRSLFYRGQVARFCRQFPWWRFNWCHSWNGSNYSIPFVGFCRDRCRLLGRAREVKTIRKSRRWVSWLNYWSKIFYKKILMILDDVKIKIWNKKWKFLIIMKFRIFKKVVRWVLNLIETLLR